MKIQRKNDVFKLKIQYIQYRNDGPTRSVGLLTNFVELQVLVDIVVLISPALLCCLNALGAQQVYAQTTATWQSDLGTLGPWMVKECNTETSFPVEVSRNHSQLQLGVRFCVTMSRSTNLFGSRSYRKKSNRLFNHVCLFFITDPTVFYVFFIPQSPPKNHQKFIPDLIGLRSENCLPR